MFIPILLVHEVEVIHVASNVRPASIPLLPRFRFTQGDEFTGILHHKLPFPKRSGGHNSSSFAVEFFNLQCTIESSSSCLLCGM